MFTNMTDRAAMTRRQFTIAAAAVGGGLALCFHLPGLATRRAIAQAADAEVTAWVVISPDNTITLRVSKPEIGQGSMTTTAQFIGDELDADWAKLKTEHASEAQHVRLNMFFGKRQVAASWMVREDNLTLRQVGAQARGMLLTAAAQRLGVQVGELTTENSVITHKASGRKLTYGEVAADAAKVPVPDAKTVKLKDPKDWKFIGKPIKRIDTALKVNGSETFGIDVKLPGMKSAAVMMSPVIGGSLKSYDANAALSRPGVRKVVEIKAMRPTAWPPSKIPASAVGFAGYGAATEAGIAVIADTYWQAKTALDAMPKVWDDGPNAKYSTDEHEKDLKAALNADRAVVARKVGDVVASLRSAAKVVEAEYTAPILHHATMEPMACTALVTDDKFEVWAPTQNPDKAILTAALVSGVPVEKGEVHVIKSGSGFGRRDGVQDWVNQSVQIAMAMKGTPVKMIWSREEDTRHGRYEAMYVTRVKGGLDASGNLIAWQQRVAGSNRRTQSTENIETLKVEGMFPANLYGGENVPHQIPNMQVDSLAIASPIPMGPLRGVGFTAIAFFQQSFMDELAVATGKDSYTFQRAMLDPAKVPADTPKRDEVVARTERWRRCLDLAAEKAEWGKPLPPGRGRGIAIQEEALTCMAVVAEVTLDRDGGLKVNRIVTGSDPGNVLNPDGYAGQVQGGSVFGLTAALYNQVTVRNGRVVEGNFDDYRMLRIDEMPVVETHVTPSGGFWGGIGEIPVPLMGPSVANALYAAGGPRVRSLPLMNHDLSPRKG